MNEKVLYFEGAGCVPAGDVENCRIRTAFSNDLGEKIYLEMFNCPRDGKIFVSSCHYITGDWDDENKNRITRNTLDLQYTKENILKFVNSKLNCSFSEIIILDNLDGYRVHKGNREYNFGDILPKLDTELRSKRIEKVKELKEKYKEMFNQRCDNTSYWCDEFNSNKIHVCLNVYENDRIKKGYNEREFYIEIN